METQNIRHWLGVATLLLSLALALTAHADEDEAPEGLQVTVVDPYVDMHTGPGRGYPVVHVVEKFEQITLLKRRTDWVKLVTDRGKVGWAHRNTLAQTLSTDGETVYVFEDVTVEDFIARRWSGGVATGDFDGASTISAHLAYRFTNNLSVEADLTQAIGNVSNSLIGTLSIVQETFPEWRISPYFAIGAGAIKTEPDATLVQVEDRTDSLIRIRIGAQSYLTQRFVVRLEYIDNIVLTSRNENEEVSEWKLGFNVFF